MNIDVDKENLAKLAILAVEKTKQYLTAWYASEREYPEQQHICVDNSLDEAYVKLGFQLRYMGEEKAIKVYTFIASAEGLTCWSPPSYYLEELNTSPRFIMNLMKDYLWMLKSIDESQRDRY